MCCVISVVWCFNSLLFVCYVIGLPNTFGEYDESPEVTASSLKVFFSFVFWPVCLLQTRLHRSTIRSQFVSVSCVCSLFGFQPILPCLP